VSLHGFIQEAIAPGSTVRTDGWKAYLGLQDTFMTARYRAIKKRESIYFARPSCDRAAEEMVAGHPPGALDSSIWTLTWTSSPSIQSPQIQISRQTFLSIGQQSVQVGPVPFATLVKPQLLCMVASSKYPM